MNKMLKQILIPALFGAIIFSSCTNNSSDEKIEFYFQEIKENTSQFIDLWGIDLYGPLILVDPSTRKAYANFSDEGGFLKPQGKIFGGILPKQINTANTALDWRGKRWAMVVLPLPENRAERLDLLSHELFHRVQPELGFVVGNPNNNHLDEKTGRVYLRLELKALEKSLNTSSQDERMNHVKNALIFRKYRQSLFPDSENQENLLEINEGLATYTGIAMSQRGKDEIVDFLNHSLEEFLQNPTFVRSFAYITTPIYGFLLSESDSFWNRKITNETDLTGFFISSFNFTLPNDLAKASNSISELYQGSKIVSEETAREDQRHKMLIDYKNRFIDEPHLVISLNEMSISFDPRTIIPIEGVGSVYPTLRLTDTWGVLNASNGALLTNDWRKVIVCKPLEIGDDIVTGNGWVLELNKGFRIIKDNDTGNFSLETL